MKTWPADKIERMKVDDLIPYERNPKIHPDTQIVQIANSIRQWGWTMPILIDEVGRVIAGHGRLFAAKSMGIEEVPCIRAKGWTEEEKNTYVIADNKIGENGEWDTGIYFSQLKEFARDGFDLSLMGVDIDMSAFNYNPVLEPDFNASEVSEKDMMKASDKMERDQDDRIKGQEGVEVICPHCAETFVFTGR